jgi:hypothetical protein
MSLKGLNTWNFNQVLRESPNVVKWNPNLAIDWMEDLEKQAQTPLQKEKWYKTAEKINFIIDFFEKSATFNHEEYWGHRLAVSRRINLNKGKK